MANKSVVYLLLLSALLLSGCIITGKVTDESGTGIELYSTNGNTVIDTDDDGGVGRASKIEWTCPTSGTYYVKVKHFSSSGTGSYYISVTVDG